MKIMLSKGQTDYMNKHQRECKCAVLLLFANTDTKWFHEWIYHKAEIRFIKGRLKFGGGRVNSPKPSMVVIFRKPGCER